MTVQRRSGRGGAEIQDHRVGTRFGADGAPSLAFVELEGGIRPLDTQAHPLHARALGMLGGSAQQGTAHTAASRFTDHPDSQLGNVRSDVAVSRIIRRHQAYPAGADRRFLVADRDKTKIARTRPSLDVMGDLRIAHHLFHSSPMGLGGPFCRLDKHQFEEGEVLGACGPNVLEFFDRHVGTLLHPPRRSKPVVGTAPTGSGDGLGCGWRCSRRQLRRVDAGGTFGAQNRQPKSRCRRTTRAGMPDSAATPEPGHPRTLQSCARHRLLGALCAALVTRAPGGSPNKRALMAPLCCGVVSRAGSGGGLRCGGRRR